ncbi:MAG: hypothetical protein HYV32_06775 [Candidatus Kerfeldbacteria bacterium]|nr:hypothetical protein [Candidatus Kerfeldbacteria bacterium]
MRFISRKFHLQESSVRFFGYFLITLSLVSGAVWRLVGMFWYTEFKGDQIRDAYIYMDMWHGVWPSLGPASSVGGFALPPLYYYLVFPFTVLGANPIWQVLLNVLCSWLSIPSLMWVLYRLFFGVPRHWRFVLVGAAGLWWGTVFQYIYLTTREWNPIPVPFFLLLMVVLMEWAYTAESPRKQVLIWIGQGAVGAILVSLHSTTWLMMPVVFAISSIIYIRKTKKWWLPVIGVFSAVFALLPYWVGELHRHGANTKAFLAVILHSSKGEQSHTLLQRLDRAVATYFDLGQSTYFFHLPMNALATIFLSAIAIIFLLRFRGDRRLLQHWLLIIGVYFFAAANYWDVLYIHYLLPIMTLPILLIVGSLSGLHWNTRKEAIVGGLLIALGVFSFGINLQADVEYMNDILGSDRLPNTRDAVHAVEQFQPGSAVCVDRGTLPQYQYIDRFIIKKNFTFVEGCDRIGS